MSSTAIGFVSSLGFLGFVAGLLVSKMMLSWRGPESPVLTGLAAASLGMGIVAIAPSVPVLAAGVFLAASSAGFTWTPFNNAVNRKIGDLDRPIALSVISTGTAAGVIIAALAALAIVMGGLSWRVCWLLFSIASVAVLVGNWYVLRELQKDSRPGPRKSWKHLLSPAAAPIGIVSFVFGTSSAIYISFAADHFAASGGVPGMSSRASPALVYICYGVFGLAGLLTSRVRAITGLPALLRLLMISSALSIALVALAPGYWTGLIVSAGLQGMYVMMTSAVLAFWSERLFPSLPSVSLTAVLLVAAAGSVAGPAVAGAVTDMFGPQPMFLGTAALSAMGAIALRGSYLVERAV